MPPRSIILLLAFAVFSCQSPLPSDLTITSIEEAGVYAQLMEKQGNEDKVLIVLVPGSRPGFIKQEALFGLVKSGYDVLSIAYFGYADLVPQLEAVPLEYLNNCIVWAQKRFPNRKIVLMGISKGAEYALSYASYFDRIDGLIAYSPSCLVIPNHVGVPENKAYHSSWTLEGEEIPFANIKRFDDPAGTLKYGKYIEPILADTAMLDQSIIKIERSTCPILLLSGKADSVWPAYQMSLILQNRAITEGQNQRIKHVAYENCGHQLFWWEDRVPQANEVVTSQTMRLRPIKKHRFKFGGTNEGTQKGMLASRKAALDFLDQLE